MPVLLSVIHASEGNIDDKLDGEIRLKQVLLPFPAQSTRLRGISIFWRDLATTHYAGATVDLLVRTDVLLEVSETSLSVSFPSHSGGPSKISKVPKRTCTMEAGQHRLTKYYCPKIN